MVRKYRPFIKMPYSIERTCVVKYIVKIAPEELKSEKKGIRTLELAFESTQNDEMKNFFTQCSVYPK